MSSKLYSRSGVFAWSPANIEEKGLIVADFAQFYDPNAASVEQKIDFLSAEKLLELPNLQPSVSSTTKYKFNELTWSNLTSDQHPSGIVAGGTEDGSVVFFDAHKFIKASQLEILSSRKDHHGHVLTVDTSNDGKWVASGGGSGQLLLWDLNNLQTPFSPGSPNFPDQVKLLRWNVKNQTVLASISAHRASCWDMRRHGSPVLEFAEIGQGCDWSSIVWCPSDASQLILASQSQSCSVVQKWDLRFTSTPLKEYRHHNLGITSVDWNKKDDRLLISSGCDGQIILWNHETGELLGGAGSLQGDWIRSVKWNEVDPNQFAVQYFQHPVQISSLSTLGTLQPGAEVLATRMTNDFIPAWMRAPLIGSSISLGGKLATYWKSYDVLSQKWVHNVEVEALPQNADLSLDVQEFVSKKESSMINLAWYLHDITFAKDVTSEIETLKRQVWRFIIAQLDGGRRSIYLDCLEFLPDTDSDYSAVTNSRSAVSNTRSVVSNTRSVVSTSSSPKEASGFSLFENIGCIDWHQLDENSWELVNLSIGNKHEAVIEILCEKRQFVAAIMYASKKDPNLVDKVYSEYCRAEGDVTNKLISIFCSSGESSGDEEEHVDISALIQAFPDDKWKTLLGILVSNVESSESFIEYAGIIGSKWRENGQKIRACIAFVLAKDVEKLMEANTDFELGERVKQGISLNKVAKTNFGPNFEKAVIEYGHFLLNNGLAGMGWKIVAEVKETNNQELVELQYALWSAAGGRECTGDPSPKNPWVVEAPVHVEKSMVQNMNGYANGSYGGSYNPALSQAPPPPMEYNMRRDSNIAPMPPSSMFYQTPSWDHKPPPTMPVMPATQPPRPVAPGWNDPPPLAQKAPVAPRTNVMQVNWIPSNAPGAQGGMAPNHPMIAPIPIRPTPLNNPYGVQQVGNLMQGMSINPIHSPTTTRGSISTPTNSSLPSPTQVAPPSPLAAQPATVLSPEDEKIMKPIENLAQWIMETARVQAKREKAAELLQRIKFELEPRLVQNRLSPETKYFLGSIAHFSSQGQFREARESLGQMARGSKDFVEISSFLPALKSLLSIAQH